MSDKIQILLERLKEGQSTKEELVKEIYGEYGKLQEMRYKNLIHSLRVGGVTITKDPESGYLKASGEFNPTLAYKKGTENPAKLDVGTQEKMLRALELMRSGKESVRSISRDIYGDEEKRSLWKVNYLLRILRQCGVTIIVDQKTRMVKAIGQFNKHEPMKPQIETVREATQEANDFVTKTLNLRLQALCKVLAWKSKESPTFVADAISQIDQLIINMLTL